ncbi:MAG: universal stress protein [Thermoanaerobaculia bacterium]
MDSLRHIVIGFDGREDGHRALAWAGAFARETPGTVLHLTHALALPAVPMHSLDLSAEEIFSAAERDIRGQLEAARGELAAAGIASEIHIRRWLPADTLIEQADELGAVLIVVGQHGGRARRVLIGSTSGQVSREARVPVVVARGALRPSPPRRILVGADGSAGSRAALTAARNLFPDAQLLMASFRDRAGGLQTGELAAFVRDAGLDLSRVELHSSEGDAAAALLALAANREVDLLCAGRRGGGPLLDLLLGSVSEKLLQLAPCPLLLSH